MQTDDDKKSVQNIAMLLAVNKIQTERSILETAMMLHNFDFNACVGCEQFPCPTAILALEVNCPIRQEYTLETPDLTLAQYTEGVKFFDN